MIQGRGREKMHGNHGDGPQEGLDTMHGASTDTLLQRDSLLSSRLAEVERELEEERERCRQAQMTLDRAEKRLCLMVQEMLCGYALHEIIHNEAGRPCDYRFLDVNPAFERMTGLKTEDVIGRRVKEIYPELEESWIEIYGKVAMGGPPVHFENYSKDMGKYFDVTAFSNEFGRFAVIFYDITERVKAREDLQHSAEKQKLFAYSVAHDLRNPAVAIHGLCKRLENKHLTDNNPQERQICRQLANASGQIVDLTERIYQFIAAKESPLSFTQLDLCDICRSIEEEFTEHFEKRGVQWLAPEKRQEIIADKLSIQRVMRNLVDNSLKYGGEQLGRIAVHVRDEPTHHVICVADDGKGLEQGKNDMLFDYFTRPEKDASIQGLGLGLAIVKEISEQHGGRAWVEKHPEKGGSIFCISIAKSIAPGSSRSSGGASA